VFGAEDRNKLLRRLLPWGLGLAMGAAIAGSAVLWWPREAVPAAPAMARAAPKPVLAASAPAAASGVVQAATSRPVPAPQFLSASELASRAPANRSESDAWRELAPLWGIALPDGAGDPCAIAQRAAWQCFRHNNGGLALIRQLDRPGLVTLRDEAGRGVHALLLGLDDKSARLRIGAETVHVSLVSLATLWQGDFATFWRAPEGYAGVIADGARGPAVALLASQLAALRGEAAPTAPAVYDAALRTRVQAFQLSQGIQPDGRAGPTTFMQLARAAGSAREPRLEHGSGFDR
jgi:general secretion pathway protein A